MSSGRNPKNHTLDGRPAIGAKGLTPLGDVTPMTGLSIDLGGADINSSSGWTPQRPGIATDGNDVSMPGFSAPTSVAERKRGDDLAVPPSSKRRASRVDKTLGIDIMPGPSAVQPVDMKKQLATADGIIKHFFFDQKLQHIKSDKNDNTGGKKLVMFFYFDIIHHAAFRQILESVDSSTRRAIIGAACTVLHEKLKAVDSSSSGTTIKLGTILTQYAMSLEHYGISTSSFDFASVSSMEEGIHKLKFGPGLLGQNEKENWAFYKPTIKFQMNILDPSIKNDRAKNLLLAGQMLEMLLLSISDYYDGVAKAVERSWERYFEKNPDLRPQA